MPHIPGCSLNVERGNITWADHPVHRIQGMQTADCAYDANPCPITKKRTACSGGHGEGGAAGLQRQLVRALPHNEARAGAPGRGARP